VEVILHYITASIIALSVSIYQSASAADVANGAVLFKKCVSCHAVEAGKKSSIGPNLNGIVGRKAGASAFNYSAAIKASNIIWTPQKLDVFLTKPSVAIKGNKMAFYGLSNPKDRADIIAFLTSKQ
jgi:cytochrome c